MLFHVRMDVNLPADMPADIANEIKSREKAYSQELQRNGKWPHIWRIAGEYANFSIFDMSKAMPSCTTFLSARLYFRT